MNNSFGSQFLRYGGALLAVALAWLLRWSLHGVLGDRFPFGTFYFAVLYAAAYHGLGPGLLALSLGALLSMFFFLPPSLDLRIHGMDVQIALGLYLLVSLAITLAGHGMRTARQRAELLARTEREGQRQLEQKIAEQQHAEEALRASERLLRLAFDASRMIAWRWDLRTDEVVMSRTARMELGLEGMGPPSAEKIFRSMHADDEAMHRALVADAIARRGEYVVEFRLIRPSDGKLMWIEERGCVECDEAGVPVAVSGVVMDIAARKRAELHNALLAELGAHLRADRSVEDTLDRVAILVGKQLGVARALFGEVDASRHTLTIHRDYTDGVPSIAGTHELARVATMGEDARQGKTIHFRDVRTDPATAHLADGFTRLDIVAFLAVPLVRNGAWVAVLALHDTAPRDWAPDEIELIETVAERTWLSVENQRLTLETRRSEEQFRIMADTVPDILFICRPDGHIEYVSQRMRDHTGLPPEAALGHGWRALIHPEDLPDYEQHVVHYLETGAPFEAEFRLRMADGSYRWFLSRARPVRGPGGGIDRWFGSNSDIDGRKRAEEALREADRRKDEFLATLAHELRNPLAPIRNAVQILKAMGPADERLCWARDVIDRQIQQMARLVDDLLDVSRITRGTIELRRQRIEIRAVVDSALELSRPIIDAAGQTLVIDLPPAPLFVDADPTRLAQVLANLLNNAAKYSEPGGHIWLTGACEDGRVVLRVRDDGAGIPAAMLPHIFDMFTQVHASSARAHDGLGIGLTLVRRLVEMHGGTIEACSEGPGRGSELVVRLPAAAAAAAARDPAPGPGGAAGLPRRRRILVVDDNVDSADSLAMLLTLRGNDVRTAYSGRHALEEARAFLPEVVLLDIGLPDMSGYEVARAMRREPALAHLLLIAQTGWGQEQDRQRSREAGFDHHLVKPIDPSRLQQLLARS